MSPEESMDYGVRHPLVFRLLAPCPTPCQDACTLLYFVIVVCAAVEVDVALEVVVAEVTVEAKVRVMVTVLRHAASYDSTRRMATNAGESLFFSADQVHPPPI